MIVEAVIYAVAIQGRTISEIGVVIPPRTVLAALRHGIDMLAEQYGTV
jgi:hypothetical protein